MEQFTLSQSQQESIKQLREENTKLREETKVLCEEITVIKTILMHPDPDSEPDVIRLHREKCEALNKLLEMTIALREAHSEIDKLRGQHTKGQERFQELDAEIESLRSEQPLAGVISQLETVKTCYAVALERIAKNEVEATRSHEMIRQYENRSEARDKLEAILQDQIVAKDFALQWIVNNPGAHPANMVAVAKNGLSHGESK